jgi:hypothetical protein
MDKSAARTRAARLDERTLLPLAALLVAGGDERIHLDPRTGKNLYGRAVLPGDGALELGACTASAISPLGLDAADRLHQRLSRAAAAGALARTVDDAYEALRAGLLAALEIDDLPGVAAVLAPSGTDAELVPLALAARRSRGRVHNLLVGPSEAGSGSIFAAGGHHARHFTPFAGRRGAGTPIAAELAARVSVAAVAVREADGSLRALDAVDAEVEARAEAAIAAGDHVIVHRLAHGKTGVFAPSASCLRRLKERHGDRVSIFVDAAQARIGAAAIRRHLADGDQVMLTGSKFYGGPPFSGVVLVPASPEGPDAPWPDELSEYLAACDLPPSWARARAACRHRHNLGLLFRWTAALAEIRSYRALPRAVQREILAGFADAVERRFARRASIRLEAIPPRDAAIGRGEAEPQEALPTVFSFSIQRGRRLGVRELKQLAAQLATPGASPSFHLGQPVRLGAIGADEIAVLRVAAGAPLVCRVAGDASCGARLEERIAWLDAQIDTLAARLNRLADERPS